MNYVVIGKSGVGYDKWEEILYVGEDKNKAFEYETDSLYHTLILQIWANGIKVKELEKEPEIEWAVTFDELKILEDSIQKKEIELNSEKERLNKLKSIIKE